MVVNVDRADRVLVRLVATTINGVSDVASADVCTHTPQSLQSGLLATARLSRSLLCALLSLESHC